MARRIGRHLIAHRFQCGKIQPPKSSTGNQISAILNNPNTLPSLYYAIIDEVTAILNRLTKPGIDSAEYIEMVQDQYNCALEGRG